MNMFKIAIIAILSIIVIGFFSVFGDYITHQIVTYQCQQYLSKLSVANIEGRQNLKDEIIKLDCEIPEQFERYLMSEEEFREYFAIAYDP